MFILPCLFPRTTSNCMQYKFFKFFSSKEFVSKEGILSSSQRSSVRLMYSSERVLYVPASALIMLPSAVYSPMFFVARTLVED